MRTGGFRQRWWLAAMIFFVALGNDHAQQKLLAGHATDFTSDMYYEPPNEQHVRMRLSGASMAPLPDGGQDIRELKIEKFDMKGKTEMIIQAPQCNYALLDGLANSAGHLNMQTGDGKMRVEGDGFLWRQTDNSLTISNNVHTVIKTGFLKLTAP